MIGAISRAVATVIVFPYIRAKVIIMSRKAGGEDKSGNSATTSILGSLVTILKDDGVSALFQVFFFFVRVQHVSLLHQSHEMAYLCFVSLVKRFSAHSAVHLLSVSPAGGGYCVYMTCCS